MWRVRGPQKGRFSSMRESAPRAQSARAKIARTKLVQLLFRALENEILKKFIKYF